MYNALNEDYMFQEMNDRVARLRWGSTRDGRSAYDALPSRRWWRRGVRAAR